MRKQLQNLIALIPLSDLAVIMLLSFATPQSGWADSFTLTTLDFPGARAGTILYGNNDRGQIVGIYRTDVFTNFSAFIYEGGIFKQLVGALDDATSTMLAR